MTNTSLFRPEVLHVKQEHLGRVFMNTPRLYIGATVGFGLLTFCLIMFIIFAEFSEKCTVVGFINATEGVTQVYAKQPGIIRKSYVHQGAPVKLGEPLFLVDTQQLALALQKKIQKKIQKRINMIEQALIYKRAYLKRLEPLLKKKYISMSLYDGKRDEIQALDAQKHQLNMELLREKHVRSYVVRAPIAGVIANLMVHPGQQTSADKPLMNILPKNTGFIAELFIPMSKAGFIQTEEEIAIHYDAYPYQRFGTARGVIRSIGKTVLTDQDENKPILIKQPYYKVQATLDKPYILIYGKRHFIQQGMTLSATVIGDKRRVWQWIFDPLLSAMQESVV